MAEQMSPAEVNLLVEVGFWALDERLADEAGGIFERLSRVQDHNPYPRIGLAMLAWSAGRRDDAIDRLRAVLGDFPEAVFTRSLLARFMKESALPGWETHARDALARVQEGAAADMARSLLDDAGLDAAAAQQTGVAQQPIPMMARRV